MANSRVRAAPKRARAPAPTRVVAFAVAVILSGCGGRSGAATTPPAAAAPSVGARPLPAQQLRAQVASAFRQGLYRMAVMDQPTDNAADLGQDLPAGRVLGVACIADGAASAPPGGTVSTCIVRWEHAGDGADRTLLRIRQDHRGCWDAAPQPRLPTRYDATERNYAEHPLNVLSSVRPGC